MSISVSKIVNLPQAALKFLVEDEIEDEPSQEYRTIGGVFSDADYAWLSNGPHLQVIHTKTGSKIGAWTFGWVLKDSNTQVVCVDEIQRPHGRLPLLAVGVDCDFSGGMVCIFDFVTSKIIRAIHVNDKITTLHVIDAGYDVFTLPSPLRNFDGIIAVGTAGGDVFLIDICRQICDEALTTGGLNEIRDELNPCQLNNITSKDISKIETHKEFAVRKSQHLAIHVNVVFDKSTKHFILKGPKGDDRIHVNKDEVTVSALYYCPQLGSLLIGYNFGALQLYNLMNLDLVYTSPVCDEHIPISHFAIQEPTDDPRAFCYIWAVYSASDQYPSSLPLAVMYAFCYNSKEYHEGYGFLYQDFNTAAVHYQMELGVPEEHQRALKPRGGYCLKLNSISYGSANREGPNNDCNEDNLTLCVLVWNVWFNNKEIDTFVTLFDLNQWYKEQMPSVPNTRYSSTYMIQIPISNLIHSATNKSTAVLDVHINKNSLQQFVGTQRLEEHFCPNSISFGMHCLRESDIVHLHNYGVQKALLAQIEASGPLCLVEPAEIYQEIIGLGLVPLFIDLPVNAPITTNQQREIVLGAALENQLMGWLCKCASEWANGSYLSTGCSLDLLVNWAFQRAVALKTNCDNFCVPLFDYSEVRLDNNTNIRLNSCTRQLKDLCSLYAFMIRKLYMFISNQDLVDEQYKSLQMVTVYFEVLQWLLNVGLLPECPLTAYPRSDDLERINAPYPAEMLTDFYNHRRGLLKILNQECFSSSTSVLFIDTLIENVCGGKALQEQWRNDGGNGLYPPPSLQALLRTYLIDDVELSYKHSVTIYVFLDLAMTLDQDKYKPVITHLIKFPAVFKVSPSLIKITQAFWQLDHGDYNTAMGLLLDPLIVNEDLNQWHHRVALRSLLLQKQHNFALLYVQVRKPTFKDDDDVLTAISLYVANNMLDEAFYFEKYFVCQANGDKFLLHLFNECKKNDNIRSIIYRSLSATDEKFFLQYLLNSKQSTTEDLHVYYHILRSRYIEAFESHERTVPNQIENQGLVGQENAIPRDKLVHSLKKLLPDINRSLLNLCHKEKNNIWQKVARPTPMSVFVHNLNENVQYKSTLIGAALAKAKQTFNETLSDKFKIETEGTPFLRTPQFCTSSRRSSAVLVTPKILDSRKEIDESVKPTPVKRLKLSPRRVSTSLSASIPTKLDTPIVKRKTPKARTTPEEKIRVSTPHSILKVKSLANSSKKDENQFEDDFKEFEKLEYTPITSKKSGLGLSPRKSLAKASPVVRFEGLKSSSSSSMNTTRNLSTSVEKSSESPSFNISPSKSAHKTSRDLSVLTEKLSESPGVIDNSTQRSRSPQNSSEEDEIFFSPETSLEEKQETVDTTTKDLNEESLNETQEKQEDTVNEEPISAPVFSPKARKSYRRLLASVTPLRSSPRLAENVTIRKNALIASNKKVSIEEPSSSLNEECVYDSVKRDSVFSVEKSKLGESVSSSNDDLKSPSTIPKLRPRKSLCRKVLETNALNRVLNSPHDSPRTRRSRKVETVSEQEVNKTEETIEDVRLESTLKYVDGEETHKSSSIKKHSLTMSLIESDFDTSEDFSIDYEIAGEPVLSSSMLDYINSKTSTSNVSSSIAEESVGFKHESTTAKPETRESDESVVESDALKDSITVQIANVTNNEIRRDSNAANGTLQTKNAENNKSPEGNTTHKAFQSIADDISHNKSVAFDAGAISDQDNSDMSSLYESSSKYFIKESAPKLSESVVRCINTVDTFEETVAIRDNALVAGDEAMDVDINEDINEEKNENLEVENVELIKNTSEAVETPKEESILRKSPEIEHNKEESSEREASSNRRIDPEMNVFEISDDLSINDDLVIEKEVTLEENDLEYGDERNIIESMLEGNMTAASTSLKVLEKNVFNASISGLEEESDREEDQAEESFESNVDSEKQQRSIESAENEVIEIGSSSDENEQRNKDESSEYESDRSSSKYDESEVENLEVSYEKNIYDTEDDSLSKSNYERHYSEISENSDDFDDSKKCELFHGQIILVDEENEDEHAVANAAEQTQTKIIEDKDQTKDVKDGCEKIEKNQAVSKVLDDMSEEETENPKNENLNEPSAQDLEHKLFDEDQLATKMNEEIAENLEDINNKDDNCEQTIEYGLFHGEILVVDEGEIRDTNEDTDRASQQEATLHNIEDENEPLETIKERSEDDEEQKLYNESVEEKSEKEDITSRQEATSHEIEDEKRALETIEERSESDQEQKLYNESEEEKSEKEDHTIQKNEDNLDEPTQLSVIDEEKTRELDGINQEDTTVEKDEQVKFQETLIISNEKEELDLENTDLRQLTKNEDKAEDNKTQTKDVIPENLKSRDPLDRTLYYSPVRVAEEDVIDAFEADPNVAMTPKKRRTRSSSVSSSLSANDTQSKLTSTPRRSTRRSVAADSSNKLDPKMETEENASLSLKGSLRPRRASTDGTVGSKSTLRKRSSSIDEMQMSQVEASKQEETGDDASKKRNQRASSVSRLPRITEEDGGGKDVVKRKKSKSVLDDYSQSRRITRQQVSLLKKIQTDGKGKPINLEYLDPIVFLDRLPFEGKADPEEKKVYDKSPSSTNSTPSTTPKASRRLRSASQASESSPSSKSKTPVRSIKGRARRTSTDETSDVSTKTNPRASRKESTETVEDAQDASESRIVTRSRARSVSVSSVNSDDLNVSEPAKAGKRRQRVVSQNILPEIKEESNKSEVAVPKKRTRKNSSAK